MDLIYIRDGLIRSVCRIDVCRDVTGLIAREEEGNLTLLEWLKVRGHLTGCRACSDYRRQLQLTVKTLAKLPIPDLSPSTRRFLLQQFQTRRNS